MRVMLSGFYVFAIFEIVSSAVPLTLIRKVIARSPKHVVSLTSGYVPTAGPEVLSLGAGVEVTTSTPGPTGGMTKSLSAVVTAVAVPPVGGADAYGA